MNKKTLLLTTLLTSSLAIAPLQANWQDWFPSKKALLISGVALTGVAAVNYLFYRKAMEMVSLAEKEIPKPRFKETNKFLRTKVTLEFHGPVAENSFYNSYSFYLTKHDKSTWHKIVNWLFVKRSIEHLPSVRSEADQL